MTNNNQKPILFSTAKIHGIIEYLRHNPNAEIQTRRVINPQPNQIETTLGENCRYIKPIADGWAYDVVPPGMPTALDLSEFRVKCPYKVGDTLWVRETWATAAIYDNTKPSELPQHAKIWHLANDTPQKSPFGSSFDTMGKKRPSIYMPRWAATRFATVTAVRAQRLHDITEEDAIAECVAPLFTQHEIHHPRYRTELDLKPMPYKNYLWHGRVGNGITQKQSDEWEYQYSSYETAVGSFSSLWESISRDYGWDTNPWVWAYTLKPTEGWQQ